MHGMTGSAALAAAAAIVASAVGLLGPGLTPVGDGAVSPSGVVPLDRPAEAGVLGAGAGAGAGAGGGDAGAGGGEGSTQVGRRWQWPLSPRPAVIRPFVAPLSTYAAGHRGLDLTASEGVAVLAVETGVVVHAGVVAGRGTVSVEHADGLRSTYEPVTASVRVGDVVAAGDRLGAIEAPAAAAHCGPTSCLHLGARRGEAYLDPLPLLAGGRVILLPFG
jgi:murein DD-endopeptidase MepM/ murein hydrolase activator NlpD